MMYSTLLYFKNRNLQYLYILFSCVGACKSEIKRDHTSILKMYITFCQLGAYHYHDYCWLSFSCKTFH